MKRRTLLSAAALLFLATTPARTKILPDAAVTTALGDAPLIDVQAFTDGLAQALNDAPALEILWQGEIGSYEGFRFIESPLEMAPPPTIRYLAMGTVRRIVDRLRKPGGIWTADPLRLFDTRNPG